MDEHAPDTRGHRDSGSLNPRDDVKELRKALRPLRPARKLFGNLLRLASERFVATEAQDTDIRSEADGDPKPLQSSACGNKRRCFAFLAIRGDDGIQEIAGDEFDVLPERVAMLARELVRGTVKFQRQIVAALKDREVVVPGHRLPVYRMARASGSESRRRDE